MERRVSECCEYDRRPEPLAVVGKQKRRWDGSGPVIAGAVLRLLLVVVRLLLMISLGFLPFTTTLLLTKASVASTMSSNQLLRRLARSVQSALQRPYSTTGRHTAQAHHHSTPRRGRVSRIALPATLGLATYAAGSVYPPETISLLFPRPAPPPPDADSLQAIEEQRVLEEKLQTLPLVQTLRASPDRDEWYETRPYAALPQIRRNNHLTAGTLHGAGKLGLVPWAWARKDESAAIIILHAGRALCGHDGIVHGGLLATLADEALGRQAIINLPDKIGVTAKLEINYKKPTKADQVCTVFIDIEYLLAHRSSKPSS
jgi:hypothetical protein